MEGFGRGRDKQMRGEGKGVGGSGWIRARVRRGKEKRIGNKIRDRVWGPHR